MTTNPLFPPPYRGEPPHRAEPPYRAEPSYPGEPAYRAEPSYPGEPAYRAEPPYPGEPAYRARPDAPPQPPADAPGTVRPRTRWLPLVGTATAAALAASLATAGLTGAFADEPSQTPASVATLGQDRSSTVPVSGSTASAPDWEAVASAVRASVVAIDVRTASGAGTGSGVILDGDGTVLTNHHVAGDAVEGGLQVTLADGRVYEAAIVGTDPTTDLAVIRLTDPPEDLTPAVIGDSTSVRVGDPVMAVGNPLGLDSTVTTGIVSALDRPVSTSDGQSEAVVTNAIQVDAAVNPGNSGGPLFDASGRVIGITSSIASLSSGGGQAGSIGLGFAIPSELADRVAAELIQDGSAEHAFLGVSLSDGTATADGTTRRGAVVEQVTAGSPAGEAGLEQGDVVVAIDDQPVNGAESLTAFVREQAAGSTSSLTVVRDGTSQEVEVTFAVREAAVQR